jgi:superfamily II DNA or RNA helicase
MQQEEGEPMSHEDNGGWQRFFKKSPGFRAQKGQRLAFEWAASVPSILLWPIVYLLQFVTGYGKTLAAYGVFWILKQRGIVDRMLVLVPTDEQRRQFADDSVDARILLGIDAPAWVIEKMGREFHVVRKGECLVYIASYQQLEDGGFFHDLMEYGGQWLVVSDECHHLGSDGRWADRHNKLPNVKVRLGLSATPVRSDLKALLGFPETPDIRIDYKEAFEEQTVKRVIGRVDHFQLDVDINGERTPLTTDSLRRDQVTDFGKYEARRQLRYNSNYLNKMLIEPLQDLLARNARHPGQHQSVMFCMSCKHAAYVCDQVNFLSEQLEMPFKAAWIGVGESQERRIKSPEENSLTIKVFKKGFGSLESEEQERCRQLGIPTEIHVLVSVDKVGEGFSSRRVSVLVFLHLIGADPKLLQQIGRGLRRNPEIPVDEDTVSIYASADTPIGDLIKRMETEANEVDPREVEGNGGPRLFTIPDLILIDAKYEKTDIVGPDGVDLLTPEQRAFCARFEIPEGDYLKHVGSVMPGAVRPGRDTPLTPQERLKRLQDQVAQHTSTLRGNIIQLLKFNGHPFEKNTVGMICKAINSEWVHVSGTRHDEMTEEEFSRKNKWLQSVNKAIQETHEVPSWVRL